MKFKFIKHDTLTKDLLSDIVRLKTRVWHYNEDEHRKWIKENIIDSDIHLLLYNEDNYLVAYLNMADILVNGVQSYGIGNVCVAPEYRGENIGFLLMNICDYLLVLNNRAGLLICKDPVVGFYSQCGWIEYKKNVWLNDGSKLQYHLFTRRLGQIGPDCLKINRLF